MGFTSSSSSSSSLFDLVNFKVPSSSSRKTQLMMKKQKIVILNSVNGVIPRINGIKKLKVAYQGVPGAFSDIAAKQAFSDCIPLPCRAFIDAIKSVEQGKADLAILPVESTMEGTELRNYDLLLQHDLPIVQEINLYVQYCLLAMPGVQKGELKKVISHPLALAHCGKTLAQLGLDHEAVEDTAGAVELLLSNKMFDTAAIASSQAALLYGLDVLAHGVQDESWNVTRFLILSKTLRKENFNKFGSKTSMVVAHHSGTLNVLLKLLSAFSTRDINLTKLEVNPSRTNGTPVRILDPKDEGSLKEFPCILYVDFEGSMDDQNVKHALAEINEFPDVFIRSLGSYSADPNIYGLQ